MFSTFATHSTAVTQFATDIFRYWKELKVIKLFKQANLLPLKRPKTDSLTNIQEDGAIDMEISTPSCPSPAL